MKRIPFLVMLLVTVLAVLAAPSAADEKSQVPGTAASASDGSWSPLAVGASPLLHTYASAFDPSRRAMLVFGGSDRQNYQNRTLALHLSDPSSWAYLDTTGTPPPPRRQVKGIYDPLRDRMIVFGGFDDTYFNDVWALSLGRKLKWTQLFPAGPAPAPRAGHAVIYDPISDRMILFGGYDGVSLPTPRRNDVWALSLSGTPAWTEIVPAGPAPGRRSGHSAAYDSLRRRMVIFGGGDTNSLNEVWALSLAGAPAWTRLDAAGTPPTTRNEQSAVYDERRDRLVIFGGVTDDDRYLGDVWALPLAEERWIKLEPAGYPPYPRWGHGAIYDPPGDRMIVFGGIQNADTWALTWDRQANREPDCGQAFAVLPTHWHPKKLGAIGIEGVTDADGDPLTIIALDVTQDEPTTGKGDKTCPDAVIQSGVALLRNEQMSHGNGRVYRVSFTAEDGHGGSCRGQVPVCVPPKGSETCVDDNQVFGSLGPCPVRRPQGG